MVCRDLSQNLCRSLQGPITAVPVVIAFCLLPSFLSASLSSLPRQRCASVFWPQLIQIFTLHLRQYVWCHLRDWFGPLYRNSILKNKNQNKVYSNISAAQQQHFYKTSWTYNVKMKLIDLLLHLAAMLRTTRALERVGEGVRARLNKLSLTV